MTNPPFLQVSVCPHRGVPSRYTPWAGTPPWAGTSLWQIHPQAGTPPGRYTHLDRYTLRQVYPWEVHPLGMYTLRQVHPICRYTLRQVHTPMQVHPCGEVHPLPGRYTPRADTPPQQTVNKHAVRILLYCNLVLIYFSDCRTV